MIVTRTVEETDLALRAARGYLLDALSWPWEAEPLSRSQTCWRRVDQLLDRRLEIVRAGQDQQVEEWWRQSWPGTPWPEWPVQDGAAS